MRDERPSIETLGRAAERLSELIGDTVIPLEQEISKATAKHFPRFQHQYGSLAEKLTGLGLAGGDRILTLNEDIADVLFTDASDAPQRIGAESSGIYDNLKWALEVKRALDNGLDGTVRELQSHCREIEELPNTGAPGELRNELAADIVTMSERTMAYLSAGREPGVKFWLRESRHLPLYIWLTIFIFPVLGTMHF